MVKANAYGHGAVESARAAYAVVRLISGYLPQVKASMREAGIDAPILVLGPTLPEWTCRAISRDLTLTIPSADYVQPVLEAAQASGRRARVHFKIDTGMTRLGLNADTRHKRLWRRAPPHPGAIRLASKASSRILRWQMIRMPEGLNIGAQNLLPGNSQPF